MHIIFQILVGIIAMCMIAGAVDTKGLTYLALIVSDFLTLRMESGKVVNMPLSIAVLGVLSGNGRIVVNLDIGDFYGGNITIRAC